MLYLIRTFGRGNKTSVKVGFTDNSQSRLSSYRIQNPFFEVISVRPGDEFLEKKLHMYLEASNLKEGFMNEWFLDEPETLSKFHDKLSKIDRTIWKKRGVLFTERDIKDTGNKLKKRMYEDYRMRWGVKKETKVDSAWRIQNNKITLKKYRDGLFN